MAQTDLLTLNPVASEVKHARRHIAEVCRPFTEEFTFAARLLTSELVSRALEQGSGNITILVASISAGVRVDVSADDPAVLALDGEARDIPRALLMDALATDWGVDPLPSGRKSMWFVLLRAGQLSST